MLILDEKPIESLEKFINRFKNVRNIKEPEKEVENFKNVVYSYKNRLDIDNMKDLSERWYNSLDKEPDYSVYSDDRYIMDTWACWIIYSRSYLKSILKSSSWIKTETEEKSLMELFNKIGVNKVVDLGNGFGYTTIALQEIFPEAKVYGTNLKDTEQYKFCELLFKEYKENKNYNISLMETYKNINDVDLIFASEYFEHIIDSIEHLEDVIKHTNPKIMLVANSYNTIGIGHFLEYDHKDKKIPAKQMSKLFSKTMKDNNYTKIKTKLWNNTPNVWIRNDILEKIEKN